MATPVNITYQYPVKYVNDTQICTLVQISPATANLSLICSAVYQNFFIGTNKEVLLHISGLSGSNASNYTLDGGIITVIKNDGSSSSYTITQNKGLYTVTIHGDIIAQPSFIVDEWIHLNQDAQIADVPQVIDYNVDYYITLPNSLSKWFDIKYIQNGSNADQYDIDVTIRNLADAYMNNTWNAVSVGPAVSTGLQTGILNDVVFQILALRIFGHAAARAAIVNDSIFDRLTPEGINKMEIFSTNGIWQALYNHRNELFNHYVSLGRITNTDDVTSYPQQMNLSNFNLSFLVEIDGRILDPSNNPITDVYANGFSGYNTNSGGNVYSTMNNGSYAIPILLSFTDN